MRTSSPLYSRMSPKKRSVVPARRGDLRAVGGLEGRVRDLHDLRGVDPEGDEPLAGAAGWTTTRSTAAKTSRQKSTWSAAARREYLVRGERDRRARPRACAARGGRSAESRATGRGRRRGRARRSGGSPAAALGGVLEAPQERAGARAPAAHEQPARCGSGRRPRARSRPGPARARARRATPAGGPDARAGRGPRRGRGRTAASSWVDPARRRPRRDHSDDVKPTETDGRRSSSSGTTARARRCSAWCSTGAPRRPFRPSRCSCSTSRRCAGGGGLDDPDAATAFVRRGLEPSARCGSGTCGASRRRPAGAEPRRGVPLRRRVALPRLRGRDGKERFGRQDAGLPPRGRRAAGGLARTRASSCSSATPATSRSRSSAMPFGPNNAYAAGALVGAGNPARPGGRAAPSRAGADACATRISSPIPRRSVRRGLRPPGARL